jgi:hypothetical protein
VEHASPAQIAMLGRIVVLVAQSLHEVKLEQN